jgi:hypothetical protein
VVLVALIDLLQNTLSEKTQTNEQEEHLASFSPFCCMMRASIHNHFLLLRYGFQFIRVALVTLRNFGQISVLGMLQLRQEVLTRQIINHLDVVEMQQIVVHLRY